VTSLATCSYQEFDPSMGQPVRISLGTPKFKLGWRLPREGLMELAPQGRYFNAPQAEFTRRYLEQLDSYGPAHLLHLFTDLAQDDRPLVLLCFERNVRSGADCHRRRFAEWWFQNTGEQVPELGGLYAEERLL
jgi:hypothetical protein